MADYRIVRLQVQNGPVKVGRAPLRSYRPAAIVQVDRIVAGPRGVHGLTAAGGEILDVHHQDHPQTRDPKGRAGILFMGTGDYVALRKRYGDHVVGGIAGETVLLDAPAGLAPLSMPPVATVSTAEGPLVLRDVREAGPCVEFSRFCLRQEPSPTVDDAVRQALIDLDHGARGYRSVAAGAATIRLGDLVTL
ncbi:MAG TPA: hypothetical protein VIU11_22790 [Nakamurella sp.]